MEEEAKKKKKKRRERAKSKCDFCRTSSCNITFCKVHSRQRFECPRPDMDFRSCPLIGIK